MTFTPQVWFITGCSTGFGRELAIAACKRGDLVIATARKVQTLEDLKTLGCETMTLDITASDEAVKRVVDQAHAIHGRIDILVNNAGFMVKGAIEEASHKDVLALYDTNVFGHLRVTRAVLPHMREKKAGIIAFIGSGTGYFAFPVNGIYGSTKFAIAGLSQSLGQEVAHLGIEVTVIELGRFQTNIVAHDNVFPNVIQDYAPVKQALKAAMADAHGVPYQDPAKGAQAVVEALTKTGRCEGRTLPRRLALGGEMMPFMDAELATRHKEKDEWSDFTKPDAFVFDLTARL